MKVLLRYSGNQEVTHCASNILWEGKFPMLGGVFPTDHPCAPGKSPNSDPMKRFRDLGYWASCFPEGDGITFYPYEKTVEQIREDIANCFGWEVVVDSSF